MTSKDYQAAFDREFPEDVKLAIGMVIQNDYRTTANYIAAEEILGQFALHLSPQIRHYRIQSNLVEALRGAHPNIFTQVVRHSSGAEWYTVIQSNSFYLTVSMVKARGRLPKRTQFRSSNAQVNSLLSYLDEPVPDRLYAIL